MENAEAEGTLLGRRGRRVCGLHLDLAGDERVREFRVSHAHAISGLNHPELDPLTSEHDIAAEYLVNPVWQQLQLQGVADDDEDDA